MHIKPSCGEYRVAITVSLHVEFRAERGVVLYACESKCVLIMLTLTIIAPVARQQQGGYDELIRRDGIADLEPAVSQFHSRNIDRPVRNFTGNRTDQPYQITAHTAWQHGLLHCHSIARTAFDAAYKTHPHICVFTMIFQILVVDHRSLTTFPACSCF